MNAAAKALLSALDTLQGRAGFSSAGAAPFFFPDLTVEGIGEIAFPLSDQQAHAFTGLAEVAPYGKGTKTKHDESVRKCWQLDAMFGTLIVALPSRHEGGQLHIHHNGEQMSVDFSAAEHRHDFQYAAFFADCEHEVLPVKTGYRFCVVFNLVLEEGDPASLNLTADDHAGPLAALLKKVANAQPVGTPTVILLRHQYTEANFSLRKLKGDDRQRATTLFAAANKSGLSARLALATIYQMGELEDGDDYHWHRNSGGRDTPDEGSMGEIYDESFQLDHWRDGADRKLKLGAMPVSLDEVVTAEDFSKIDPDEKTGEGYTGNAGCTMEYWYRRAAVVMWPEGCEEEIRCAKNMADACESLLHMSTGKKTGQGSAFDKLAQAAIRVMCSQDDSPSYQDRHLDTETRLPITRLALALARAKRSDLVEKLADELPPPRFAACPQGVWRELFSVSAPDMFAVIFTDWLKTPEPFRKPLFAALSGLLARRSSDLWVARTASALARLKPVEIFKWESQKSRDPIPPGDLDESRILMAATSRLTNKPDIAAAISFLKSDSSLFAVRKLIGPLFIVTDSKALLKESAVARELLKFCKDRLAEEITRLLVPYPDWRRPCPPVSKERSPHQYPRHYGRREPQIPVLEELAAFMADPATKEHAIRRREDQRMIAEAFIRTHFLDLDCRTIRQGTPHTLLCTKNDRSHQHELEWRKKDEIMLRMLQKC